jgi:hypothetical protein
MGGLLLLGIVGIILILGFGFNAWVLGAIVLGLTMGMAFAIVGIDIEAIKQNWNSERCRPEVMLTAFLYKKSDDPRSTSEFAKENFNFCLNATFKELFSKFLTPILTILNGQLNAFNVIGLILNVIRDTAATLMSKFQQFMDPFFRKFVNTGLAFSQVFMKLLSAMRRVGGIAIASVFAGMSIQVGILNFVDFIVKIVMIILYILIALVIFLFFLLVPSIPLILITIAALAAAGIGGVDGMGGAFCLDPDTQIELKSGKRVALQEIRVGDTLLYGGKVEGVLRTEGIKETMYSVDGIFVSGSHLILDKSQGFLPVHESILGKKTYKICPEIICLRTEERIIGIRGNSGELHTFADWEELPKDISSADDLWDSLVSILLNSKRPVGPTPSEYPLLHSDVRIMNEMSEKVPISSVKIGDHIYSQKDGFIRVTGIYKGKASFTGKNDLTDGIWMHRPLQGVWEHPHPGIGDKMEREGYHISTESGTFWVETNAFSGDVRDFTEVGEENLFLTYNYTRSLLKKSFNREEPCAQDSL